jgi:hypothetical protein
MAFFLPESMTAEAEPLGQGNVNDTWLVRTTGGTAYVLQRLNPAVFPNPGLVQDNLCTVTRHLRNQLQQKQAHFTVLQVFTSPRGKCSWIAPDGAWWRLLSYIESSRPLNRITTAAQAWEVGRTLGFFHHLCSTLEPAKLHDPLPGFHDTPCYLDHYDRICPAALGNEDAGCSSFIAGRRQDAALLTDALEHGIWPLRTTHGDPKVANFLFTPDGSKVVSLIDLDTVRPGLLLHDIGDCLRSCCNPNGEEMENPDDIPFDKGLFAAVLEGYSRYGTSLLSFDEKKHIIAATRLISFELGLRFYTDYLIGNRYFKVSHAGQNLLRARVQFRLVQFIEEQYTALETLCSTALHGSASL